MQLKQLRPVCSCHDGAKRATRKVHQEVPHRLALWLPVVCRAGLRRPAGGSRSSCHAALCALPAALQQGPLLQSGWRLPVIKLSCSCLWPFVLRVRSTLRQATCCAKFGCIWLQECLRQAGGCCLKWQADATLRAQCEYQVEDRPITSKAVSARALVPASCAVCANKLVAQLASKLCSALPGAALPRKGVLL